MATVAAILDILTKWFSNSESPCHPNASHHGGHFGCWNGTYLAVLNLHGGHLGYWNGTNLAILNLQVTPMPPNKFRLNPTYRSGADVVWKNSRWPPWQPFWISEWNNFSHSKSLCCSNASHQVSAQSDMVWEEMKIFKTANIAAILDIGME